MVVQRVIHRRPRSVESSRNEAWSPVDARYPAGRAIAPTCNNLLIVRKDLGLDRNTIVEFGRIARKFFAGV